MLAIAGVLFAASGARVVGAFAVGETFGTEATLAFLFVVACGYWAARRLAHRLLGIAPSDR
jgi:hypothetical protein